jgi:hypothetical protein
MRGREPIVDDRRLAQQIGRRVGTRLRLERKTLDRIAGPLGGDRGEIALRQRSACAQRRLVQVFGEKILVEGAIVVKLVAARDCGAEPMPS